ncbi:type II toxin-antitoxin system Phd/YefM family antitoxin [Pandoraea sputorum]|uniref:type II toxin-antitoxin system Phd/YefM family antitoxin n=1 Tax=Pandoraea sputorum TaxID=93222 RepID=UPI00123FCA1C|nr:type II toxin-antitoxin system Phd/YefM family antitoxin [Pandoraea sputorum]VVE58441.1 antitoxin [Pandoraea sputorum]
MQVYNIHDAKTNLSRLLDQIVKDGEEFVIAKAGKPLVKVSRIEASDKPVPRIGFLKGQFTVPKDFDTMASAEIADLFEGTR